MHKITKHEDYQKKWSCLIELLNHIAKHHAEEQVEGKCKKPHGDKEYRCSGAKDSI